MADAALASPQGKQIQLRIADDVLRGTYANIMRVDTTKEEFILDFGTINPVQGNGSITARVFMNPGHAKRMIEVLQRVMAQYEGQHGQVAAAAETNQEIGFHTS